MSSDPAALRRLVLQAARDAGASACAIAAATPDDATAARFGASVARGDLATWPYDGAYAARASDPAATLPGARSIVCVAVAYATPAPPRRPLRGRVSNYAWSRDYHARLHAVLAPIARALDEVAGEPCSRVVCDTAPLAERAFAARAGLAWIGKHTNAIVPGAGSFVFLGEVLATLDIEPDAPLKKSCGSCARCVTACPTGALRGDYTIDASRCISDLTQRTDGIPRALRPLVGEWVWGCDLCQDVCPPTRRAGTRGAPSFAPHGEAAAPDLQALLALRSAGYKRTFRGTAMGWRGAATLRRNAAVALGNALDRATVPALGAALHGDPHPQVRGHAAWALGRVGSPRALALLLAASEVEAEDSVRGEIDAALEPFGNLRGGCGV